jgi:hypothetical protein
MHAQAQQRHCSLQVRAARVWRWVIDACIGMHVVVADTDDVTSVCNVGSLLVFLLAGREGDPCMCCARTAASSLASLSTSFFGTPSAVVEAPAALEGALNKAMAANGRRAQLDCDQQLDVPRLLRFGGVTLTKSRVSLFFTRLNPHQLLPVPACARVCARVCSVR